MSHNKITGAGIIPFYFGINDTKILLLRGKQSGKWSFPKGFNENNESIKQTAVREMKEETSIDVPIYKLEGPGYKFGNYKFWYVKFDRQEIVKIQESEIIEHKWISIQEFMNMDTHMLNYPVKMFKFSIENKKPQVLQYIKQNERKFNVRAKEFVSILEPSS